MKRNNAEFLVGLFVIVAIVGLVFLALKVSGLTLHSNGDSYIVQADFDNIGSLKVRAPITVAGVTVGRVQSLALDPDTLQATVMMQIDEHYNRLPIDTSASILTQGILGANYIGLTPGFEEENLKNGSIIRTTHPALILENLIGQLVYSMKSSGDKNTDDQDATTAPVSSVDEGQ